VLHPEELDLRPFARRRRRAVGGFDESLQLLVVADDDTPRNAGDLEAPRTRRCDLGLLRMTTALFFGA